MIDIEQFSAKLGNNAAIVEQVFKVFIGQHEGQIGIIREALEAGNLELTYQTAHSIKGALANLCAAEDAKVAETIEHIARAGEVPAAELIDDLDVRLSAAVAQINEYLGANA